jgi:hypothetical protein
MVQVDSPVLREVPMLLATSPHWLGRFGLVETPAGTTLQSASLSLRGGLPWWLAIGLLVLGAGLAVFFYFRESARLTLPARLALIVLRTGLIALVLLLLLRPILLAEFAGERPRGIVVLVDNSQSISRVDRRVSDRDRLRVAIAKGWVPATTPITQTAALDRLTPAQRKDPTRRELVEAVLASERFDVLGSLARKGPVQVYLFDRQLRSPEGPLAAALKADGAQTALADAIHEALTRLSDEPPAAIVVISDGLDNSSQHDLDEVARTCRDRGVPLHIWGVGSSEAGALQLIDARLPSTVFVDDKPEVKDDAVEVPVRFRCRGFRKGTIVLTLKIGDQEVRETFPVREGENLTRTLRLEPRKGKEGQRPASVSIGLREAPEVGDEVRKVVQVKNSRIKVLYVENTPRREYKFIQPALDRDRRMLMRLLLVEGDRDLADMPPDRESGALFVEKFPERFPEPDDRDPDRRPFDIVILGDVPYSAVGDRGARALRQFVKEGGGLVVIAGRQHCPAEYAGSPLAEVLPVEFTRVEFTPEQGARATPFRPVLTYDGEQSVLTSLVDTVEDNRRLWKEELWKHVAGFWFHYPVLDLRPGATALVVHPDKKSGKIDKKPMPVVATHHYGKGEVLFVGTDETWRWRDSTGDRLTARFWGQITLQLGLPHLLGNSRRTQMDLERGGAVLGRPGGVRVRLLDTNYEGITRPTVRATLVNLNSRDQAGRQRDVILRRVPGQPGEYRGALPNDVPGRYELRLAEGDGLQGATLPFRVELPPRHELEEVGLNEEGLRSAAATSGGRFYREEDLHTLADSIESRQTPFTLRQEVILWNNLALFAFVVLISLEWLLRKFSNLS